ncbi:glycosyltransferase [Microbacterium sp. NPDC055903]
MAVVFISVGVLFVAVFLYPYLIYPALLKTSRTRPLAEEPEAKAHTGANIAAFFCAYNEIAVIGEKIDNLRALRTRYPDVELWAFDDGSTDGTAEALEAAHLGIRVIRGGGRSGKAHGMKLMVRQTEREFLVFTDANVMLDVGALDALATVYADENVGGVCGVLHYVAADGTATEQVGGLYWRLEEQIKAEESRSGNVMGADGSIFSVRRELYPDFPDTVQDDFTVSMAVIFAGRRLITSPRVIAVERLVASRSLEWSRKIRIAVRAFHTYEVMRQNVRRMKLRDRFRFASHKWLRWHGGYFLCIGASCVAIGLFLSSPVLGTASTACVAAALLVASRARTGVLASAYEMLISVLATSLGVTRARRGHTQAVWNPPR